MNLPNKLSLCRIFLVPVFLFIISLHVTYGDYIAAGVFVLAAFTDGLDGYIARKNKLVTRLGKLLDPLADKLLITSALIALVELGRLPGWVAILIIGREFAITGLRAIVVKEGVVIAASKLGKYKTVSQIIAVVILFLQHYLYNIVSIPFGNIAVTIAVIFTVWSGYDYFKKTWVLLTEN
ncbi:MAG: CDP-diacylglycerol--glycerol-3-phosphate 3-phosphatidyltransferase [Clostridiales bacterium]|nr:CDP-diacylglycerol--glycerol-3-phosphate 3-phosphatidyltransferase [Clostridiales bacterium]MCF8023411.1 CDP-diacylglycerol--glycerol-3-phosphate 3-phosphatidyltransferase [Clostridiales bacterium]